MNLAALPTEYAHKVFNDRYAQQKDDRKENRCEMLERVLLKATSDVKPAFGVNAQDQFKKLYQLFDSNLVSGAGRQYCNMGGTGNNMPFNCFVLPIEDSREGIYKTLHEMAEIESKGGGVGINFSKLRPKGAAVKGSKGFASGPCSFINIFNTSIETISQGGCLAEGTRLLTGEGYRPIEYLAKKERCYLILDDNYEYPARVWFTGNKECITLYLTNGRELTCTPEHIIFTTIGELPASETLDKTIHGDNAVGDWPSVYKIESAGILPVYDFEEVTNNRGYANSILVHNSRRGAMIAILNCDHPDIEEFIRTKADRTKWNNLNVSVGVTDDFMKAVSVNGNWDLVFDKKVYKTVRAMDLWNLICSVAYDCGEPGVVYLDTLNTGPLKNLVYIDTVNPCQPADSLIQDGYRLRYITDQEADTWTSWKTGEKEVLEISTNTGLVFRCTPEHKIRLYDGTFCEAKSLVGKRLQSPNNYCTINNLFTNTYDESWVLFGYLFGDGFLTGKKQGVGVKLNPIKEPEIEKLLLTCGFQKEPRGLYYINRNELDGIIKVSDLLEKRVWERDIPEKLALGQSLFATTSFLRGLYAANGSCNKVGQISLKTTNLKVAKSVQLLLGLYGIHASICKNESKVVSWGNGDYTSKVSFNVQTPTSYGKLFQERIGFIAKSKANNIREAKDSVFIKVVSIKSLGIMEVWDYQMKNPPHYNYCQGTILSNCGEQPLVPYGACNLGSIILPNFYIKGNSYHNTDCINWELLKEAVRWMVVYLDNLIDVGTYPLPEIEEQVKQYRPIGLGVMGLADLLFLVGLPYGNHSDTLIFVRKLFDYIYNTAKKASEDLAANDRGTFPAWNPTQCNYAPRRNATLISIAPTGTITTIYGASWSIEPYYSVAMIRNESLGKDIATYQILDKYLDENKELPSYARFVIHDDPEKCVTVEDHLAIMSAVSNFVDCAVSKTINLKNDASIEDVKQAFKYVWEHKIKGCTIYRDGCREGAIKAISNNEIEEEDENYDIEFVDLTTKPKERPQILEGRTYKLKYNFNKPSIYITINSSEDDPFEIFFNTKDSVAQEWLDMLSMTITALFRRGITCDFLVNDLMQYESASGGGRYKHKFVPSAAAGIGLVLKDHLQYLELLPPDANPAKLKEMADTGVKAEQCPKCFEFSYVRASGCGLCASCGHSECE